MMSALFLVLLLSVLAIVGVAVAVYFRITKKVDGSATSVRQAVHEDEGLHPGTYDREAVNGKDN